MPYQERYVAFIDILGFSEIIRKTSPVGASEQTRSLETVLSEMGRRDADWDNMFGDDFKFLAFSDSIVMSEAISEVGLLQLLDEIASLSLRLLRNGLLMRGGISKGLLYHEDGVMFGPAFLDAYRLESTIAKYPRIVLGREVHLAAQKIRNRIRFADDGPPYIHVLHNFEKLELSKIDLAESASEGATQFRECRVSLQRLINEAIYEPNHYEKLKWFGVYWNSVLRGDGASVTFPIMNA